MRKLWFLVMALGLSACDMPAQQASKVALPEPESAGAKLMTEFCSTCHAPPRPSVHTAKEWPNVIYRMQEHRRMKSYNLLDETQVGVLVGYLQSHAKGEG